MSRASVGGMTGGYGDQFWEDVKAFQMGMTCAELVRIAMDVLAEVITHGGSAERAARVRDVARRIAALGLRLGEGPGDLRRVSMLLDTIATETTFGLRDHLGLREAWFADLVAHEPARPAE